MRNEIMINPAFDRIGENSRALTDFDEVNDLFVLTCD